MPDVTPALLLRVAPQADRKMIEALAPAMDELLPAYGVNTPLRLAHFLAQAAHETDGFRTLVEYGGPAYFRRYDGRKDLGNLRPGDGVRYKGRGIFQLTGRFNYEAYGRRLGIDLVNFPERASEPALSVRIAGAFWKAKGLNAWADRDDVVEITRRINGGRNGLADRRRYLARAKAALKVGKVQPADSIPKEEVPDAPIAAEPTKPLRKSVTATAAATGGAISIGAAVEVGRASVEVAQEAKDHAEAAGELVGLDGSLAVVAGLLVIVAVGCAVIFYRRWRKSRELYE